MIPLDYKCSECGVHGVRLWRPYQSCDVVLMCADCSCAEQGRELNLVESDTIAWRCPAIPDLQGNWWGYTSVPAEGVAWWKALPVFLTGSWLERDGCYTWYSYREGMDLIIKQGKKYELKRVSGDYKTCLVLLKETK